MTKQNKNSELVVQDGIRRVIGNDGLTYTFDENNRPICGAKKKDGTPCRKPPLDGRNRCRLHGGMSPRGLAHPRAKDLRYSKDIFSKELAKRYEEAANDKELLSTRDEIAVMEARIANLLQNVDTNDTLKTWTELSKYYNRFLESSRKGQPGEASAALQKIGELINKGVGQHQMWREISDNMSVKRKLMETEQKRLIAMQQTMTAEQAMSMLTFVVNTLRKHVNIIVGGEKANEVLIAVSTDISKFVSNNKQYIEHEEQYDEDN